MLIFTGISVWVWRTFKQADRALEEVKTGLNQALAGNTAYRELEPWHAQVHTGVHRALEAAHKDWLHDEDTMESIITAMRDAQEASHHVIQLIDALLQQRHAENRTKNA